MAGSTTVSSRAPFDARWSAYIIDGLIIFVPTYPIVLGSVVQRDFTWWPLILIIVGIAMLIERGRDRSDK